MFDIFSANCVGVASNCSYPIQNTVTDEATLADAVKTDYVCAKFTNNYRSNGNFISSDCLPVDCDNDHSEKPEEWVTVDDVKTAFPDVTFAVHYSRNHMKEKKGKAARPKFHVFFPITTVSDAAEYAQMKKRILSLFPYFDHNALDAARFFFGTSNPVVEIYAGTMNLTTFLDQLDFDADMDQGTYGDNSIPVGERNSTMSRIAGRLLIRYGDSDEAYQMYLEASDRCTPALEEDELATIWNSALRFYQKVSQRDDYIPPEEFKGKSSLKPDDYSDVGQATVLANEYRHKLRFSTATKFIVYENGVWTESEPKAQGLAQDLTLRQLKEVDAELESITDQMQKTGVWDVIVSGTKKGMMELPVEKQKLVERYKSALAFRKFITQRRDSKFISAALREARPMLEIGIAELDAHEFLLNTQTATYDLREGLDGIRDQLPEDFITKQTSVDPSDEGRDIWEDALNTIFLGNKELIEYVQTIVGIAAIGAIHLEALVIAHGGGRNGKSTFWNTISRVLGSYSGNFSADSLTSGCKRNIKPEMAELKGKRLVIAAELNEGTRLSTSVVKQISSTDEIYAEKKYKDPFSFLPSHLVVLYTNHLPKVGALDEGIWRRLIVIPFDAVIEGSNDIKNYADYLYRNAGGAVLSWIIEGAKKAIQADYKPDPPQTVLDATTKYRKENDWLNTFLDECCELDSTYSEKSGELYSQYRAFCVVSNEYVHSTTDFYSALEASGYVRKKTKAGSLVYGLRLKSDFLED